MQRISVRAANNCRRRQARRFHLQSQGTPELKKVKDPFGNEHRLGVLGISRQSMPGDVATKRVNPATALWLGVKETWFVIDQTLSYMAASLPGGRLPTRSVDLYGSPRFRDRLPRLA